MNLLAALLQAIRAAGTLGADDASREAIRYNGDIGSSRFDMIPAHTTSLLPNPARSCYPVIFSSAPSLMPGGSAALPCLAPGCSHGDVSSQAEEESAAAADSLSCSPLCRLLKENKHAVSRCRRRHGSQSLSCDCLANQCLHVERAWGKG